MCKQTRTIFQVLTYICLLNLIKAQRGSYAGSVASNGNQKNKYLSIISTRKPETPTLAFGASQRPPLPGVAVVYPEPEYVPLDIVASVESRFDVPAFGPNDPLPLDARGDRTLVERLMRLPEDKRPFWLLNYKFIEAARNNEIPHLGGPIQSQNSLFG